MSGRLVGEVIDWLQTPAAVELTLAERAVLMIVAERSNEKTRDAWRHRTDEQTIYDRIRNATGLTVKGLSTVLRKLRDRDLEVRVPVKVGKDGRPIYAYEGMAMRFRLPEFPASVSLPESPSQERASEPTEPVEEPVENPPEGAPGETESPSGERVTDPRAPLERAQSPSQERALVPLHTSTTNTSKARGLSDHGAEEEVPVAEPAGKSKIPFDFRSACAYLVSISGDVQAAAVIRAAKELGPGAENEDLKIRAAEIAAKGIPA